jgi:hypothetical protein
MHDLYAHLGPYSDLVGLPQAWQIGLASTLTHRRCGG